LRNNLDEKRRRSDFEAAAAVAGLWWSLAQHFASYFYRRRFDSRYGDPGSTGFFSLSEHYLAA
jgi:hypothetical protein